MSRGAGPYSPIIKDMEGLEADYRSGMRLHDLAAKYGCTHAAIRHHARANAWTRDLAGEIRSEAAEKAARYIASSERVDEVVERNSDAQASILIAHRADVAKLRKAVLVVMDEFDRMGPNVAAWLSSEATSPEDHVAMISAVERRVASVAKLADAMTKAVTLERLVTGIDRGSAGEGDVADALRRLAEMQP